MTASATGAGARVELPILPAVGLSAATGGALLFGTAGLLTAAGGGIGCLFALATGVPCPFCGMTHGVAALGAGDLSASVAANPLSPLAVALALAVPFTLLRGRPLQVRAWAPWALAALVTAVWLVRIL